MNNLPSGLTASDLAHIYGPQFEREIECSPTRCDDRAVQQASAKCAGCCRRTCSECVKNVGGELFCPHCVPLALEPFEFFLDGTEHFRLISAGPCEFFIKAPGRELNVGSFGGVPEWLTTDGWNGLPPCPAVPSWPPRIRHRGFVRGASLTAAQQGAGAALPALSEEVVA